MIARLLLAVGCGLIFASNANATDWFIYPNPPGVAGGGGHKYISRKAAVLAQHETCIVEGNIYARFAGFRQSGLSESEAITQNAEECETLWHLPPTLSPLELNALRAIYRGSQYNGLSLAQVKAKKDRDCLAAHPVPPAGRLGPTLK